MLELDESGVPSDGLCDLGAGAQEIGPSGSLSAQPEAMPQRHSHPYDDLEPFAPVRDRLGQGSNLSVKPTCPDASIADVAARVDHLCRDAAGIPASAPKRAADCESMIRAFADFCHRAQSPSCSAEFNARLDEIEDCSSAASVAERSSLRGLLLELTREDFACSDMFRRAAEKPLGYAGDFQLIDWIYTEHLTPRSERGQLWDRVSHQQAASIAVRERKERFKAFLAAAAKQAKDEKIRILSVGSGSCREISEGLDALNLFPGDVEVECLDIDPRASVYAKQVLGQDWSARTTFHVGNAMRFRSPSRFDVIWSSGLFDYLSARQASFLASRLLKFLKPSGSLVIGNFSDQHTTRNWLEWCGDWFLVHRSEDEMHAIAQEAELGDRAIQVLSDPQGAMRYLVVERLS